MDRGGYVLLGPSEVMDKAKLIPAGCLPHCLAPCLWSGSRRRQLCEAQTAPGRLGDLSLNKRQGFHRNFSFILNRFKREI